MNDDIKVLYITQQSLRETLVPASEWFKQVSAIENFPSFPAISPGEGILVEDAFMLPYPFKESVLVQYL